MDQVPKLRHMTSPMGSGILYRISPAAPVGPVAPALPDEPVLPVAPVAPDGPVRPVGPVDPVKPMGPVGPVGPKNIPSCGIIPGPDGLAERTAPEKTKVSLGQTAGTNHVKLGFGGVIM